MNNHNKKILVVDDDEDIRDFLAYLVAKEFSVDVKKADSSESAIRIIEDGERFWLIVCDYHMVKANGNVLQDYLVSNNISSYFIFFTSDQRIYTNANHEFCLGVVAKPNTDILISKILQKLNSANVPVPIVGTFRQVCS